MIPFSLATLTRRVCQATTWRHADTTGAVKEIDVETAGVLLHSLADQRIWHEVVLKHITSARNSWSRILEKNEPPPQQLTQKQKDLIQPTLDVLREVVKVQENSAMLEHIKRAVVSGQAKSRGKTCLKVSDWSSIAVAFQVFLVEILSGHWKHEAALAIVDQERGVCIQTGAFTCFMAWLHDRRSFAHASMAISAIP